jgi:chromosome segregation ATPase
MPKSSIEKKMTQIIKRMEKEASKNKAEIQNQIYINQHLTTINIKTKEDNFFLKKFIQDLQYKCDEAHKYNNRVVYNLQLKLEESEQKNKDYLNVNQVINKKLDDSENFNQKLKKCLANTFKKLYSYQKQNDELIQNNKDLENKYNTLIDEYRCFRRDIDQNMEESLPLIDNGSLPSEYQFNKLVKYSFANFENAKKIDNKKTNKDNILLLNKTMNSHSKDNGNFPSLLTEIQSFLTKGFDTFQNEATKTTTNASNFNTSLNKENEELKKTVAELSSKLLIKGSECVNLSHKLENIKTKLSKMQVRMSTSPNRKQEIVSKMIGKTNELDVMKKEYKKLNCDFKVLSAEHAKLNQKYLDVYQDSQGLVEYKTLFEKSEALNHEFAAKIDKLTNDLASKEYEMKEAQGQLENIKNTYQYANTQSNSRISSYQTMVSNMQQEIDELKDYKQKYSDLIKKVDVDKEQYVKKYQQLAKETMNCNDFKSKLDDVNFQKTLDVKTKTIKELESRLNELSEIESDLIDCQKDKDQLNNEIDELYNKLRESVSKNNSVSDELFMLQDDYQQLDKEHDKLIEEYEKLLGEHTGFQDEIKQLKNQLKLVTTENEKLKLENDELNEDLKEFEDANNTFDRVLKKTQSELDANTRQLVYLQDVYQFTSETRDKLEIDVAELQLENEKLRNELKNSSFDFKNYVMKGEFLALQDDYDYLIKKCNSLQKTNTEITANYNEVIETNKELTQENNSLDTDNIRMTTDKTNLTNQIESLN